MPTALRLALLAAAVLLMALLSLVVGARQDVGVGNVLQLLVVDDGSQDGLQHVFVEHTAVYEAIRNSDAEAARPLLASLDTMSC
jgi:DNA-binding FadR family transcriptional regulator